MTSHRNYVDNVECIPESTKYMKKSGKQFSYAESVARRVSRIKHFLKIQGGAVAVWNVNTPSGARAHRCQHARMASAGRAIRTPKRGIVEASPWHGVASKSSSSTAEFRAIEGAVRPDVRAGRGRQGWPTDGPPLLGRYGTGWRHAMAAARFAAGRWTTLLIPISLHSLRLHPGKALRAGSSPRPFCGLLVSLLERRPIRGPGWPLRLAYRLGSTRRQGGKKRRTQ